MLQRWNLLPHEWITSFTRGAKWNRAPKHVRLLSKNYLSTPKSARQEVCSREKTDRWPYLCLSSENHSAATFAWVYFYDSFLKLLLDFTETFQFQRYFHLLFHVLNEKKGNKMLFTNSICERWLEARNSDSETTVFKIIFLLPWIKRKGF